jgi:hypothetical protein
MVPTDLSAPKTALHHPQEHTTWVRPSPSSTIVVRCSIVVAAPVPLDLTVLSRFCAGSAALGWRAGGGLVVGAASALHLAVAVVTRSDDTTRIRGAGPPPSGARPCPVVSRVGLTGVAHSGRGEGS